MGWSSGSEIFEQVIKAAKKAIPDDSVRREFYKTVYFAFADADWDTEENVVGQDAVFDNLIYDVRNLQLEGNLTWFQIKKVLLDTAG